jgi:Spy/CpxP family protein refolding chaperone
MPFRSFFALNEHLLTDGKVFMIKQRLLIAAGILALTALPIARPSVAQSAPTSDNTNEILKTLALTPGQKIEVDKIQNDATVKIKAVLGSEQLKRLSAISKAGKADPQSLKTLNLSQDQKIKLNEVQKGVAQKLFSVLTPDQQQKLIDQMIARAGKSK